MDIESELNELLSEPVLASLKNEKDDVFLRRKEFLLEDTEPLYKLWIKDREIKYPFFIDGENPNSNQMLAEHERVRNFIYSINIAYYNAYVHLYTLYFDFLKPLLDKGNLNSKSTIDHRFRTLPGDYFVNLCGTLHILSLLMAFIQGYPLDVYSINMKKILGYLKRIEERDSISVLSDDAKLMSKSLINKVLPIVTLSNGINWVEQIYAYRNFWAHKNFMAFVITNNGKFYLPQNPNILPSIIINTDKKDAMKFCNPEPLHDYCLKLLLNA